ncbi:MAG: hypothetical protein KKE44_26110, partial [Proteobacteria bacterium]|nr:hypothetical protein [Pseudomonadota bacterium]
MKNIILSVLIVTFAIIVTFSLGIANSGTEPEFKPHFKNIPIKTEMGNESLASYFDVKGSQVVIFVPGKIFDKESWYLLTERLQQLKVASLSLDGKTKDVVLTSINVMKEMGYKKIALVGGSMGGAAIL